MTQQGETIKSKDGRFLITLKEPLSLAETEALQFLINNDPVKFTDILKLLGFSLKDVRPLTESQIKARL